MATETTSNHTRADSAIDGIESFSKTFATAQNFCTAVSSFASENGVQALHDLLQRLPQRENEIKAKEDTIRDLKANSAAKDKSHKAYTQQQLSDFEDRYDLWAEESSALQGEVEDLKALSKKKDTEIQHLRTSLEKNEAKIGDLEKEHTHVTTRLKERNLQLGEMEARLQNTESDADARLQELKKSHEQLSRLKTSFNEETQKCQSFRDEATRTKERLQSLVHLSVKIKELDLPETIDRVDALWRSAINLVGNFVGQNMSDDILQNDWTKLRENSVFKHRIPLPQSNSDIAKEMRVAVVVGALAQLVDNIVFQPTFILDKDSWLRDVLRDQARIDPRKERYARGIFLSMFPEDQEANSKDGIGFVVGELLSTVNVRILLPSETISAFEQGLESFVTQIQEEWKVIQRGRQKLEPDFSHSNSTNLPWHVLEMPFTEVREGNRNGRHLSTGNMDDDFVIVPRFYLIGSETDPSPVTHGYVLRKAHLDAAEEEVRRSLPSAPFARTPSSRHRSRPVRGMSVTGDAAVSGRSGSHFLSQARGAPEL